MMTVINQFDISGIKLYFISDYNFLKKEICINDIQTKSIICLLTSWYESPDAIQIANQNKHLNIVLFANSEEEEKYFKTKVTCDVILCNKSVFINENKFVIKGDKQVLYDLVIDSCFADYKNRDIARKIDNIVNIGYSKDADIPNFGKNANYNANGCYKKLNGVEITDIYNESYVGGIFSLVEGACLASAQYLLCGLPVVSTKSKGGRDFWYNAKNSIICDNNQDDCYSCVQLAKKKIINGEFNREEIRESMIELMQKNRNMLKKYLKTKIIDIFNIDVSIENINLGLYV